MFGGGLGDVGAGDAAPVGALAGGRIGAPDLPDADAQGLERGSELLGRQFSLHEPIIAGRGKIKAGDTLWLVIGPDLPVGSSVRVIGQDGVLLKVEAIR